MKELRPAWHKVFAAHGWWARFVTNVLRWPYRWSFRRPAFPKAVKKGKLRFTYEYDYSGDDDYWKRQEIELGFDKKPEAKR